MGAVVLSEQWRVRRWVLRRLARVWRRSRRTRRVQTQLSHLSFKCTWTKFRRRQRQSSVQQCRLTCHLGARASEASADMRGFPAQSCQILLRLGHLLVFVFVSVCASFVWHCSDVAYPVRGPFRSSVVLVSPVCEFRRVDRFRPSPVCEKRYRIASSSNQFLESITRV